MVDDFQAQLKQARRKLILNAAIDVIAEQGFQRTTIKQIAKRAGVADGTIYNYFKNKEAIMEGIVAQITATEAHDIQFAEAENIDLETFIRQMVTARMADIEVEFKTIKIIMAETLNNAEFAEDLDENVYQPIFKLAEQYFQSQMDAENMPQSDPAMAVRLFSSPLFGLMLMRLMGDEHIGNHWEAYVQTVTDMLVQMYRTQSPDNTTD